MTEHWNATCSFLRRSWSTKKTDGSNSDKTIQYLTSFSEREKKKALPRHQAFAKTKVVYVYLKLSKLLDWAGLQTSLMEADSVEDWVRNVLVWRKDNYADCETTTSDFVGVRLQVKTIHQLNYLCNWSVAVRPSASWSGIV